MTPAQFQIFMARMDKLEAKVSGLARTVYMYTGGVIVIGFLIQQGVIKIQ